MSHVYQPAMLIAILENKGAASVTDIAKKLLSLDISQVEYYQQITKNMVGRVLTNHKITEKQVEGAKIKGYGIVGASDLSDEETLSLIALCQAKINEYVAKRGDQIWQHRRRSIGHIPGTLRYEVLKRAKSRCELCGVSADLKGLEVDHIVPRNHGGTDDLSNLQALCYRCNAMKRDLDDTDFRDILESYLERAKDCLFCEITMKNKRRIVIENELCYAIRDQFPVTNLHTLLIPKRHVADYFSLHQPEINALHSLANTARESILASDSSVTGFNLGVNSGQDAGQTIFHCHVHLIPRRKGDIDNPRGGVRGVIPDKRIY